MSIDIPDHFDFTLDLDLGGSIGISQLPKINIGVDPIEIKPLEIAVTELPKINIGVDPIDFSLRLKEIPSIRMWFPIDYKVALGLFGIEMACVHFCGQSQVITEPYVANPCECGGGAVVREPIPVVVKDANPG